MKFRVKILIPIAIIVTAIFSMLSVSADDANLIKSSGDDIAFTLSVEACTGKKDNGKIICSLINPDPDSTYQISFNSGKKFREMTTEKFALKGMKSGCYTICLIKNNDPDTISSLYTVYVGNSKKTYPIEIHTRSVGEKIYKDGKIRIYIDNYDASKTYEYTVNGGKNWRDAKGSYAAITGFTGDNYKVMVREKGNSSVVSPTLTVKVPEIKMRNSKYIKTEKLLQLPELPTGCEVTTLTMLLNHIGFKADKLLIADKYLPKGKYRASDFTEVFVGDPRSIYAYGCYADVIVKTAEKYLKKYDKKSEWTVRNITGCTIDSLYSALDNGNPVIVWATSDLKKPTEGRSWVDEKTGKTITWVSGEHCMLLVGYNKEKGVVYANDPLIGIKAYNAKLFKKRFKQLGNQAIIIVNKS